MTGIVEQINLSPGGIPKLPVPEARVTALGLSGDAHNNPKIHGGPHQALLFITVEGIGELSSAGFEVTPGALGENITTKGLDRRQWRVGQRWRIGPSGGTPESSVIVEFTKLRAPCRTLDPLGEGIQSAIYDARAKRGDPETPAWGLSGFYARVLQAGVIRCGDIITKA